MPHTSEYSPSRAQGGSGLESRDVMLHELQHAIQEREGFTRGSSPESMKAVAKEAIETVLEKLPESKRQRELEVENLQRGGLSAEQSKELDALIKHTEGVRAQLEGDIRNIAWEAYRRDAGEVEARNVEGRAFLSKKALRESPPWKTESVPREKQTGPGIGKLTPVEHDPFAGPSASVPEGWKVVQGGKPRTIRTVEDLNAIWPTLDPETQTRLAQQLKKTWSGDSRPKLTPVEHDPFK